ncbi:hypothetical protein ACFPRL_04840 [Pseudoclavibacter helvolus]
MSTDLQIADAGSHREKAAHQFGKGGLRIIASSPDVQFVRGNKLRSVRAECGRN